MRNFRAEAEALHRDAIVIDTHADTPQRFADDNWSFTDPLGPGQINLETAKAGGLDAEFFAIWVEPTAWRGHFAERTMQLLDATRAEIQSNNSVMRLGLSAEDIEAAHRDGVFCALMGIEGGHSIEANLDLLRRYYDLGIRYMTLTWSNSNEWADSSGDIDDSSVPHHGGLTDFGKDVVREMNRLGMMVDVSHVSDDTFWDVVKTSRAPILASHSNARVLTDVPRNLTDEQLRAVAASNGVVMVNFYSGFVDSAWRAAWNAQATERGAAHGARKAELAAEDKRYLFGDSQTVDRAWAAKVQRASFDALIDHFDHIARIAGIDHVGIGTDFDGIPDAPAGIDSAADLPKVTEALLQRGYTAEQLKKLLGGNLLRVFRDTTALANR